MNQVDHNINKDMNDFELIDVETLDFSDDQTWLYKVPGDSGQKLDIVDWSLSLDWPVYDDEEYEQTDKELYSKLDEILNNQVLAMPDRHKFDSRTYVKPKKRVHRPSIQNIVEGSSNSSSLSSNPSFTTQGNKYLTYNKYSSPLAPMLRLKTFNVEANTDNCSAIKEYASKRKSFAQDDDPQLEDIDMTLVSDVSGRLSTEPQPSKPINIDFSQPAHNLHNTFNKGVMLNDRGSLNMYQSGESLMRMSPPSLVSSLLMETSGNYNADSLDNRKSISQHRDAGNGLVTGRESIDPMMTSMTLSILDEKDMSTSFLSQTTYPDNDSFMDSLPPSLVSSVNSSYVVSNSSKARSESLEPSNIFSSATFTHLEQSEKLLSARPRHQMYNSFRRETPMRNSESYTKSREEGCQIDSPKILNENNEKKETPKSSKPSDEMAETITLHYSNNKFRRNIAEKENLNSSFEKDDAFYKDMGMQRAADLERNSLNVTLDKQELNEIIQARQKLSLARKALPNEPVLPNQVEPMTKTFLSPNQTVSVPKKSIENASELLSRRRVSNGLDKEEPVREPPKRNATFKKTSPKTSMDMTVVFVKDDADIIDINSATMNLIDPTDRTLQHEEWGSQERAMVGSSESTDTATFSSSSPPDSVPDTNDTHESRAQIASTPFAVRKTAKTDLLNLHTTISPIYNMVDDKSYTVTTITKAQGNDLNNTFNSNTIVKRSTKRDILAGKMTPEKKMAPPAQVRSPPGKAPNSTASYSIMPPPSGLQRRTGLPTSKLRQYSSHRELRPLSGTGSSSSGSGRLGLAAATGRGGMLRRGVYASNPALSPTHPAHPAPSTACLVPPTRRDSYTIAADPPLQKDEEVTSKPVLTNPPVLVRQGTETLSRRERPQSQLMQPKDAPTSKPNLAPQTQTRVLRPTSGPAPSSRAPASTVEHQRPLSGAEPRVSALPRPSRLPGPRRTLRPPSVYSVAPTGDVNHY